MRFPNGDPRDTRDHVFRLTLVNIGGPNASPPYSEDTGLCICSTETFQSEGPAAAETCMSLQQHVYVGCFFFTLGEGWDRAWTKVERWGRASGVFGEDERIVRDIEVVFFWTLECDQKAVQLKKQLTENRPSSHLDDISDRGANKKGIRKLYR